jgi:hypothetical protein
MRGPALRLFFVVVIGVLSGLSVWAQITTLKGLVTDPDGAVIPGAQVFVRSGNRVDFATRTDAEGIFLANIRSREVTIEISAPGFLTWYQPALGVPNSLIVDLGTIALRVGAPLDLLECPLADPELVETPESKVSSEIENRPLEVSRENKPDKLGRVSGRVSTLENRKGEDRKTEKPVANAFVRFSNSEGTFRTRTDSKGHYRLNLPPGKYDIYAAVDERCPFCIEYYGKDFEVRAGKIAELNMVLRFIGEGSLPSKARSMYGR